MRRLLSAAILVATVTGVGVTASTTQAAPCSGTVAWVTYGQQLTCQPKSGQPVHMRFLPSTWSLATAHSWCTSIGGSYVATRYLGVANVCININPALIPGATTSTSTTTLPTSTSTTSTSTTVTPSTPPSPTSTTLPPTPGGFATVPVGGTLPTEATCAGRVQPMTENRPNNATPNATRGNSPNDENQRVTGNYVGTTDEIIQWAACKWGLNVDYARSQAALESYWIQSTIGDAGESFGLLQVRRPYHASAFENENAVRSTAYNADYTWSIWRRCFDGEYSWLNTVEHGATYAAGDGLGCMGVWFSGRWRTPEALGYMGRISQYHDDRVWAAAGFPPALPRGTPPSTSTPATTPSTSVPPSAPTSSSTTTLPPPPPSQPGTWQQIAPPSVNMDPNFGSPNGNFGFQSITAAPDGTVYVTADRQGLWRSTDRGATWVRWSTDGDLETGTPWTLQVDPANPSRMWANAGYGTGGPLLSTDGGHTWTKHPVGSPTQSDDVYSIALDPNLSGHMLVAWHSPWTTGSSGITESFDGGQTWVNHPPGASNWGHGHAVFFLSSTTWLVGTQDAGIWRTTNSGGSWQQVSSWSITHGATGSLTKIGTTLFLAHGGRISRSTDNGQTWTDISSGLPNAVYSTVATDGVNLYTAPSFPVLPGYGSANGRWYTRPVAGGTWQPMNQSPTTCYQGRCNGPRQTVLSGGFVFTSNYSGGVWRLTPSGNPPPTTTTTSVALTTSSTISMTTSPTTAPSTTSSSTTTSTSATTTSSPPASTTLPPQPTTGFLEDFNGNPGAMSRFRYGALNRDIFDQPSNTPFWQADHQLLTGGDCTPPTLTHTLEDDDYPGHEHNVAGNPIYTGGAIYVCSSVNGNPAAGHVMTTMGDISGYSWVWFTPDRVFNTEHTVSFDVSVTDELLRSWWEVMIVPATGPDLACAGPLSPFTMPCEFTNQNGQPLSDSTGHPIAPYPTNSIVLANGVLAGDVGIAVNGVMTNPSGSDICSFDPEGCASVAIRRPMAITENPDGTITFQFGARSWVRPGQFPAGDWKVIFSQHSYTPFKDGHPISVTFHWDNISVH